MTDDSQIMNAIAMRRAADEKKRNDYIAKMNDVDAIEQEVRKTILSKLQSGEFAIAHVQCTDAVCKQVAGRLAHLDIRRGYLRTPDGAAEFSLRLYDAHSNL